MGAIIIKGDTENNKILAKLAKKLGNKVISINEEEYEDFALGKMMDESKTGQTATREEVMKKLKNR
ncbi:MAG: hypothetical protein ACLFT6_06730 [Bacteroidales bacterium]